MEVKMTKTAHYLKVTKPMLERKRRARINKCLDQLKGLMVECLKQDGDHITRLDRADILELTVDYLAKEKAGNKRAESFRNGYINAANEVSRVLATVPGVDIALGKNIMTHLGGQLNQLQEQFTQPQVQPQQYTQQLAIEVPLSPVSSGYHSDLPSPTDSLSSNGSGVWRPW